MGVVGVGARLGVPRTAYCFPLLRVSVGANPNPNPNPNQAEIDRKREELARVWTEEQDAIKAEKVSK